MQTLYENDSEEALHNAAIEALAQEVQLPISKVRLVYEDAFAQLKSDARVTDYLSVFVSRRAREALRKHPPVAGS